MWCQISLDYQQKVLIWKKLFLLKIYIVPCDAECIDILFSNFQDNPAHLDKVLTKQAEHLFSLGK